MFRSRLASFYIVSCSIPVVPCAARSMYHLFHVSPCSTYMSPRSMHHLVPHITLFHVSNVPRSTPFHMSPLLHVYGLLVPWITRFTPHLVPHIFFLHVSLVPRIAPFHMPPRSTMYFSVLPRMVPRLVACLLSSPLSRQGKTKYTGVTGSVDLREAICADLARRKVSHQTLGNVICYHRLWSIILPDQSIFSRNAACAVT